MNLDRVRKIVGALEDDPDVVAFLEAKHQAG
jgi:hypothetical protein